MARLFLSLTDDEFREFESAMEKAGLTRSKYLKMLLSSRRDIRPISLKEKELIHTLSEIERDLKIIAMKESLSDEERIPVLTKIEDIKTAFKKKTERKK